MLKVNLKNILSIKIVFIELNYEEVEKGLTKEINTK